MAASSSACFQSLDGHGLLGSQGYTPRSRLLFQKWKEKITFNDDWEYKPTEAAVPAASESGDRVYIGGRGGELVCLEVRRGKTCWRKKLGSEIRSEILFHEGVLYVGAADGHIYAVDAEVGKVNWKYNVKSEIAAKPVVSDDKIYFTSAEHSVYALDLDSGEWRWTYTRSVAEGFTMHGTGGVLVHKGAVYAGFADGFIVSLKAADGALQWEKKLSSAPRFADVDATPVIGNGAVITSSFIEGLFSLDSDDGLIRWKIPARGASSPTIVGPLGYFTTPGGEVVAFDVKGGAVKWRAQITQGEGHLSDALVYKHYILVSSSHPTRLGTEGGVWVLDRESGKLDTVVDLGPGVHGKPFVAGGNLFFLTDTGWFYAYRFGRP